MGIGQAVSAKIVYLKPERMHAHGDGRACVARACIGNCIRKNGERERARECAPCVICASRKLVACRFILSRSVYYRDRVRGKI